MFFVAFLHLLCTYRIHHRSDLLHIIAGSMAFLRCQQLRLDPIRLANGYEDTFFIENLNDVHRLERGICLGTVVLWVLFVWLEASVRLREIKTIDLCRPFAAHW